MVKSTPAGKAGKLGKTAPRRSRTMPALLLLTLLLSLALTACSRPTSGDVATPAKLDKEAQAGVVENYGKLPLRFESNQGQFDTDIKYSSRGQGFGLYLTGQDAVLALQKNQATTVNSVRLKWLGGNAAPTVTAQDELPGKINYYTGNNAADWQTGVGTFGKVHYQSVYPGIDLVFYGNQQELEYDFVVAPGANPQAIKLGFEGADKLEINEKGELLIYSGEGSIIQKAPVLYQQINGVKQPVSGKYLLNGADKTVTFEIGAYDPAYTLVIDPVLGYSTYLGGSADNERGYGIAVDSQGNAVIVGYTISNDFPVKNAAQGSRAAVNAIQDAFVTKLNPDGTALVFSTYLSGSSYDYGYGVALDSADNIYVAGETSSADFPVSANAYRKTLQNTEAFLAKLTPTGTIVYSTYIGGTSNDYGRGVAVDAQGNAYIVGNADAGFITTPGVVQPTIFTPTVRGTDTFVAKVNPQGTALVYATYVGGNDLDRARGIAVDSNGNAYVTGDTTSPNFPTVNAAQGDQPQQDAFVYKLNANATALVFSTYLGGADYTDTAQGIAVDSNGNAYVGGLTNSLDFPVTNGAFQTVRKKGGVYTGFLTKYNPTGSVVYSTLLGGTASEQITAVAVDAQGQAFVTGIGNSSDFPIVSGLSEVPQNKPNGKSFIAKFNAAGSALGYSTWLGGNSSSASTQLYAIAVDKNGAAYVTGFTNDTSYPVSKGAFQSDQPGEDAVVTKINPFSPEYIPPKGTVLLPSTIRIASTLGNGANSRLVAEGANPANPPSASAVSISAAGVGGIPANATGIVGVLTNVGCTGGGNLRFWTGTTVPSSINLNIPGAQFSLNLSTNFVTTLDSNGKVNLGLGSAAGTSCGYAVDVTGFFTAPDVTSTNSLALLPATKRISSSLDNAPRLTATGIAPTLGDSSTISIQVTGSDIPAGAVGIMGVLTNVGCTGGGNLRFWTGNTPPNAINLNVPGANAALNLSTGFIAALDANGKVNLGLGSAPGVSCGYAVDVTGYIAPTTVGGNSALLPAKVRIASTLNGQAPLTAVGANPAVGNSSTITIQARGVQGIPVEAKGVIGVLTNVGCNGGGNLRFWTGNTTPNSNNLNVPGANPALNLSTSFTMALDADGKVNLGFGSAAGKTCGYAVDIVGFIY